VILVLFANDLPAPPYPKLFDLPAPKFPRETGLSNPRLIELFVRLASNKPIYRRWPPYPIAPFVLPSPDPTNPWTGITEPPPGLDHDLFQAMKAGKINAWLWGQATGIAQMLSHDFSEGNGSPEQYLTRIRTACKKQNCRLMLAYVPFYGVTSKRYAAPLVQLGMDPTVAGALSTDPIYRRQNENLAQVSRELNLPFADTTDALIEAETQGEPQFWEFDSHPRPGGNATIARRIFDIWRQSEDRK
jgi:hypothetical protein